MFANVTRERQRLLARMCCLFSFTARRKKDFKINGKFIFFVFLGKMASAKLLLQAFMMLRWFYFLEDRFLISSVVMIGIVSLNSEMKDGKKITDEKQRH